MSWKRGFLRLWIVIAVIWIGVGGWWEFRTWQEAREYAARQAIPMDLCNDADPQKREACETLEQVFALASREREGKR